MTQEIKKILEDLYRIDPGFKQHEQELVPVLEKLIKAKPDLAVDEAFVRELRAQVMDQAAHSSKTVTADNDSRAFRFADSFALKMAYAFAAIILVAIVAWPIFRQPALRVSQNDSQKKTIDFRPQTSKLAAGMFGSLKPNSGAQSGDAAMGLARGMGGGGGAPAAESAPAPASDKMASMIAPIYQNYVFAYAGEEFEAPGSTVEVLRRTKRGDIAQAFSEIAETAGMGLIDIGSLKNKSIQNVNLSEDREFGYTVYLDFRENMASVFSNWERWPHPDAACNGDSACYERNRLKAADMPADSELIAIADAFLAEYGIDRTAYGEPQIQNDWRRYYGAAEDQTQIYVPEEIAVIYPTIVNGQKVYESYGQAAGISVNVNIRHKKAAGVYGIALMNLESSSYPAVSDTKRIVALAERGGSQMIYRGDSKDAVKIELDTPVLAMMKYYNYNVEKNSSDELYIPALVFAVKDAAAAEKAGFYQKNVIVPLAEEVFTQFENNDNGGIMPLMKDAEAPAAVVESMESVK